MYVLSENEHDDTEMILELFNEDLKSQLRSDIYTRVINQSRFLQ